jgi:hypothetical protein
MPSGNAAVSGAPYGRKLAKEGRLRGAELLENNEVARCLEVGLAVALSMTVMNTRVYCAQNSKLARSFNLKT